MKPITVTACVLGVLLSITLLILSIYTLIITNQLSIPLPALISTLSLLLPILTPGVFVVQARNSNRKISLRLPQIMFLITIILDTVLLTYTVSALNPDFLTCQLETKWHTLFRRKNSAAIRSIQDRMDCCGFRSVRDDAWPFPSKHEQHGADACIRAFPRRGRACMNVLINEEKKVLAIMIAIGGVSLLSKLLSLLLSHFSSPVWFSTIHHQTPTNRFTDDDDDEALPSTHPPRQAGSGGGASGGASGGAGNESSAPRRQIADRSYIEDDHAASTEGNGDARRQQRDQAPLISLERGEWGE